MVCICAIWSNSILGPLAEVHHAAARSTHFVGLSAETGCGCKIWIKRPLWKSKPAGERETERDTQTPQTRGASAVGGFAVACGLWTLDCGLGRSYPVHSVCSVPSVLNGTLCLLLCHVSMFHVHSTRECEWSFGGPVLPSPRRFARANLLSEFF